MWRVMELPGVVSADIDERANRIRIGVSTQAGEGDVRRLVADLGIPPAAVAISRVEPYTFFASTKDRFRPVPAGVQIESGTDEMWCTLGPNLRNNLFLIPSHCTASPGANTAATLIFQHRYVVSYPFPNPYQNLISDAKILDPPFFTGGTCPAGRRCRQSDAAVMAYATSRATADFPRIVRPINRHASQGSLTIDPANPRFSIVSERSVVAGPPHVGEVVDKVGHSSGWTYGPVAQTCVTVNVANSNITLFCQTIVNAGAHPTDSGAPVFFWVPATPNAVQFVGMLSGGNYSSYFMSTIDVMESELGNLQTY